MFLSWLLARVAEQRSARQIYEDIYICVCVCMCVCISRKIHICTFKGFPDSRENEKPRAKGINARVVV